MDTDDLESEEKESLLGEIITDYLFSYGFEEPKAALFSFLRAIPAINDLGKISNLKKRAWNTLLSKKSCRQVFKVLSL